MAELICGDAREVLAEMAPESIHACITNPPYWGLRDYGCPEVVFVYTRASPHIATAYRSSLR
jgi:DNA modification methylase